MANPNDSIILWSIILLTLCGCRNLSTSPEGPKAPPNILFIMADDHANSAVSCYGSTLIKTPNIDRIAGEGILFRNSFVTNSICAPSRAVLLTGKYSHRNGHRDNRDTFDGSQLTFPKLLQEAGYYTAMIGKWHLKSLPTGFDDYEVLIGQGSYYNPRIIDNGDTVEYTGYTTDLITDLALSNLDDRDTTKPFCLFLHHKAPHRNWMPEPDHFSMYEDEPLALPETFYDDYSTRSAAAREQDMRIENMYLSMDMKLLPSDYEKETGTGGNKNFAKLVEQSWLNTYNSLNEEQKGLWDRHYDKIRKEFRDQNPKGKELLEWKYQRYIKDYLRCIKSVDESVGRVLDYLEENGLSENTLVVYTSDQGFYLGEHGWYDKRFMYEESLKMPLVMRYPGLIAGGRASDEIVLNLDFAPTFLDFAGVTIPEEMQGMSMKPILEGSEVSNWRKSMYYHYYEYPHGWHDVKQHYGIRTDRYKLIHFYNDIDAWEFYDLEDDPHELNNLIQSKDHQATVRDLKEELTDLQEELGVSLEE